MRQLAQMLDALIGVRTRRALQTLRTEALHSKGAHGAAVEHRATEDFGRKLALRRNVTVETAGERVPCTSRIDDLVQRQPGRAERAALDAVAEAALAEVCGSAVLAVLHDERLRPERHHRLGRAQ